MVNQLVCFFYLGPAPFTQFVCWPKKWPQSDNFCNRLQVELFHLIWWGHLRCRFWDLNVWTSGCSLNGLLWGLQGYSEETYKDRDDHSSKTQLWSWHGYKFWYCMEINLPQLCLTLGYWLGPFVFHDAVPCLLIFIYKELMVHSQLIMDS